MAICRDELRDALTRYVVPLLPHIDGEQARSLLPLLVGTPPDVQAAHLVALMHTQPPPLPPAQLLHALHLLVPGDGGVVAPGLRACYYCLASAIIVAIPVSDSNNSCNSVAITVIAPGPHSSNSCNSESVYYSRYYSDQCIQLCMNSYELFTCVLGGSCLDTLC